MEEKRKYSVLPKENNFFSVVSDEDKSYQSNRYSIEMRNSTDSKSIRSQQSNFIDEEIESPNKIPKIFSIIYSIFLISIFIQVYFAKKFLNEYSNFTKINDYQYFKEIEINWKSNLIKKILSSKDCDKNDTLLIETEWQGTKSGCKCYDKIKDDFCSFPDLSCLDIEANEPEKINIWRGTKICKKNYSNETYLDLIIEEKEFNCPSGTRSCGLIDSMNNHLCINHNTYCPIIEINIFPKKNINLNNFTSSNMVNLTDAILTYTNDEKKYVDKNKISVPINTKISIGQPCRNPFYVNENFTHFVLDNNYLKNSCFKFQKSFYENQNFTNQDEFFDKNYQLIDVIEGISLLKTNSIFQKLNNFPTFFKNQFKTKFSLFQRKYFGLKIKCLKEIKENNLSNKIIKELEFIGNLKESDIPFVKIIAMIFAFIFSLILGIYNLLIIYDCLNVKFFVLVNGISGIIVVGLYSIKLIFTTIQINKISKSLEKLKFFDDLNCVDDFTKDLYNMFLENIDKLRQSAKFYEFFIINIAVLILFLIAISLTTFLKKK